MKVDNPNELTYGMLGFFAERLDISVNISDLGEMDNRQRKAMCEEWEHLELVPNLSLVRRF